MGLLLLAIGFGGRLLPQTSADLVVWEPLLERLTDEGHDPGELRAVFEDPRARYDPSAMASKLQALLRQRRQVAGETREQPEVHGRYLSPLALAGARAYLDLNLKILEEAERLYGVDKEIQVAILLIESKLGMTTGKDDALVTLASMALSADFERVKPHIGWSRLEQEEQAWIESRNADKAAWAYRELSALLRYAKMAGRNPLDIPSSVYGAIGYPQFMPSNALAYGVDGDGDGVIDLFTTVDAVHSLCNFLKRHGWRQDLDRERRHEVIYKYNHDHVYARTVLAIADRLKSKDGLI